MLYKAKILAVMVSMMMVIGPHGAGLGRFDFGLTSAAWADEGEGGDSEGGDGEDGDGGDDGDHDDDSDDDHDDDDDDDDSANRSRRAGQSGERGGRGHQSRAPDRGASRAVTRVQHVPDEITLMDASGAVLAELATLGYATVSNVQLNALGRSVTTLTIPQGLSVSEARAQIRALTGSSDSTGIADFNHFYRASEGTEGAQFVAPDCAHANCDAWETIQWPRSAQADPQCRVTVPIGLIDTGINAEHEIVSHANLEVVALSEDDLSTSRAIHGTAVASILIGGGDTRVPGLVSEAPVIAVDAFKQTGDDERADLLSILQALDLLVARDVRVINLSLTGPDNALLSNVVAQILRDKSTVIVAAVGNGGPRAAPAFPAAYEGVIAVTAVDANRRIYRQAQRGSHLDLAAPGVNLLAATSISGARHKTGTSFAAPVVSAAAALLLSQAPEMTPQEVANWLRAQARDLGAPGPDEIFGAGLLQAAQVCDPHSAQP